MVKKSRMAQAWGFDLMIASVIFISGIVIFYVYAINYPKESQETLDKLITQGDFIAETLLDEGLPADWNTNNVLRIGLTSEDKINNTKLERFYILANNQTNPSGYAKSKSLFNTKYNFFMNFSDRISINGTEIPEGGIGQSHSGQQTINVIKVTRAAIYNNKIISVNIYIWE